MILNKNKTKTVPTFYFIGVTTTQSSIMKVFPRWMVALGRPEVVIEGVDLQLHDSAENYRQIVSQIKHDPRSLGALVTTHKLDLFAAASDLFDHFGDYAQLGSEVSSISKRDGRLEGHAKDPITCGLSMDALLGDGYFGRTKGNVLCFGAGGAGVAAALHLIDKKAVEDRPKKFTIIDILQSRLDHMRETVAKLQTDITFEYIKNADPAANDAIMGMLPAGSVVINATGMGKDRPGSPVTDAGQFPLNGVAWEFNYRGDLDFMHQALAQREARQLVVEDGWLYFLHGWTQVIAQVLDVEISAETLKHLGEIADFVRKSDPQFVVQQELVAAGLAALDSVAKAYLIGGAESEATILRNRAAIERRALRPRVLVDVNSLSTETTVLKRMSKMPIFLAPIGALHRFHSEGDLAAGVAASNVQIPMFFGSLSPSTMAEMRAVTTHDAAYQLYVSGDEMWVDEQVRKVEKHGFEALCLTVDSAVYSRRERDLLHRFTKPWRKDLEADAMTHSAAFTWRDIGRIRNNTTLPIILKGIASPEDAKLAIEHGVDVVYVSNHGGRQLDHAQGTMDGLDEIAGTVAGQAKLFVDGGFLRGTDIVKALAIGADAVGIGRLTCFALAANGEAGVTRMLQILEEELVTALALVGASSLADLTRNHVVEESFLVSQPHLLSAFPLMNEAQAYVN